MFVTLVINGSEGADIYAIWWISAKEMQTVSLLDALRTVDFVWGS